MDSTETIQTTNMNPGGLQNPVQEKPTYSIELRVIAGILVVALLLSIVANAAVRIHIQPGDRAEAAATNYLVDNTDYVQEGRLDRMQTKVQTLGVPETLEDYYLLAGTQIAEEKYADALDSIGVCLTLCDERDHDLYVDLLMKQGCLLVLVNQNVQALTVLDQVITQQPDLADAYLVKAQVYAAEQQLDQLETTLIAYLNLIPGDSEIRTVLAQTQYLQGRYGEAAKEYAYILDHAAPEQDTAEIAYLCGLTYLQLEQYDKAADYLLEGRAQNPELEAVDYYIGVCQMSLEQYAEAVNNLTKSIDKNSMLQLSYYSRGICGLMLDAEQQQLALKDLQFAAEYQGADADETVSAQAAALLQELEKAEASMEEAGSEELKQE